MESKNIFEEDKFKIHVDKKTLENPNKTKELARLKKKNPNIEFDLEPSSTSAVQSSVSSAYMMEQPESIIEPKDSATIKYLSNVKDANTGEISQPFSIGDKKYQMVRGLTPDNNVVMAVYCFDETDEQGNNIIHDMQYFEENIAKPMKEVIEKQNEVKKNNYYEEGKSIGLGEYKHYIVNERTGKFRKFKTIDELAKATMNEEEKYMGIREFKKYFESKVFGAKKHIVSEVAPTGDESDEEMNIKAKKLMDLIQKRIPSNIISTIKTPVAKREVIAAFAELIGVPRNGLAQLISGLKDMSKVDPQQQKQQQAAQLKESKTKRIIKVKDLKNG